ncbi:MAG: polyprenyl synthetase family protein [Thermoguttaceae bacterium]
MATPPIQRQGPAEGAESARPGLLGEGDTGGLKIVPPLRSDRERIREAAFGRASHLDGSRPLGRRQIEAAARQILAELGLSDGYRGWTMVAVATAFWQKQVEGIPPHRRLLLLPHCLRNSAVCQAEYDQWGLICRDCGGCELWELRRRAQRQGYRVLIAEGSPAVLEIILHGGADAILGAACLNSLEKVLDRILAAGIPCMAVPLLASTCRDTSIDVDWVRQMIDTPYRPGARHVRTYVHVLQAASRMFEADQLERLLPRRRSGTWSAQSDGRGLAELDPVAVTELLALDFLRRGGKHFRPFLTLAAYDAMAGAEGAGPSSQPSPAAFPDPVCRVALAIELFHKASLVHDDVEDDDPLRYGQPTLHRKYGISTAINVGDYLIGLGYRLVAEQRPHFPGQSVPDILARLAEAHTRLCEGQGAELAWRAAPDKRLAPLDALTIYALKTAPAFEAALYAGLRLAGPAEPFLEPAARFARHLGVAFQILNDLDDWRGIGPDPAGSGLDILAGRPTVLWALALQRLSPADCRRLERLATDRLAPPASVLEEVRLLYQRAEVFQQADRLVARHRQRAHQVAEKLRHKALAHLLHYLADRILDG